MVSIHYTDHQYGKQSQQSLWAPGGWHLTHNYFKGAFLVSGRWPWSCYTEPHYLVHDHKSSIFSSDLCQSSSLISFIAVFVSPYAFIRDYVTLIEILPKWDKRKWYCIQLQVGLFLTPADFKSQLLPLFVFKKKMEIWASPMSCYTHQSLPSVPRQKRISCQSYNLLLKRTFR